MSKVVVVVGTHCLLLLRVVVGACHLLLSRVVVVVGNGCLWAVVVCVLCWWCWALVSCHGWAVIVVGGPCPSSWGPGIMDIVIVIQKVTVDMACSVKPYACHVSSLVVALCVRCHCCCCSLLSLSLSLLLLLLSVSIVVAVADMVVTVQRVVGDGGG